MAARTTPAGGSKPDKLMRDALRVAVMREDPVSGKKIASKIAEKLVDKALEGDIAAIREINDRIDGKSVQPIAGSDEDSPIHLITEIRRVIVQSEHSDG